jgi:hypothetical protein
MDVLLWFPSVSPGKCYSKIFLKWLLHYPVRNKKTKQKKLKIGRGVLRRDERDTGKYVLLISSVIF